MHLQGLGGRHHEDEPEGGEVRERRRCHVGGALAKTRVLMGAWGLLITPARLADESLIYINTTHTMSLRLKNSRHVV